MPHFVQITHRELHMIRGQGPPPECQAHLVQLAIELEVVRLRPLRLITVVVFLCPRCDLVIRSRLGALSSHRYSTSIRPRRPRRS